MRGHLGLTKLIQINPGCGLCCGWRNWLLLLLGLRSEGELLVGWWLWGRDSCSPCGRSWASGPCQDWWHTATVTLLLLLVLHSSLRGRWPLTCAYIKTMVRKSGTSQMTSDLRIEINKQEWMEAGCQLLRFHSRALVVFFAFVFVFKLKNKMFLNFKLMSVV